MKAPKVGKLHSKGYTLIEIGIVIALLAILAAFALVSFGNTDERRDATMVQSAQAALQSIVSQGSVRMDKRPDQLDGDSVLTALQATVGEIGAQNNGVQFSSGGSNQFTMNIRNSGRSATFVISNTGDVRLLGLNNFPNYVVDQNGTIKKGP